MLSGMVPMASEVEEILKSKDVLPVLLVKEENSEREELDKSPSLLEVDDESELSLHSGLSLHHWHLRIGCRRVPYFGGEKPSAHQHVCQHAFV